MLEKIDMLLNMLQNENELFDFTNFSISELLNIIDLMLDYKEE